MTSLADLRARVERAYANERAAAAAGWHGPRSRDVARWSAAVTYGECVALFEALAAAEAERDAYREALRDGVDHGETIELAAWCALVLDRVERAVLAAPVPPAPAERET